MFTKETSHVTKRVPNMMQTKWSFLCSKASCHEGLYGACR